MMEHNRGDQKKKKWLVSKVRFGAGEMVCSRLFRYVDFPGHVAAGGSDDEGKLS